MKGTGFGTRRFPEGAKQKISGREELPFVRGGAADRKAPRRGGGAGRPPFSPRSRLHRQNTDKFPGLIPLNISVR
ncbi:MAG: hypothetical protein C6P37_12285 [Caldibacillus debilis]|uniref:Uncharacterized protein n=1 Tax=Caldibacillus debilis TaxID=301148 RepID=A0A3E0K2H2_9BACI|nr:hypothetical protein [Bacillaceae bacterium]REJ27227.1 MAG: hypothetical protein C6P37_12285 [Caldibacillus debilis]